MGNCYTKQIDPSKFKSYDDVLLTEELRKTRNTISFKFNQQRVRTKEEVLSQYKIQKLLGKGLFSKVYQAYNQEGKKIALKIVKKKNFLQKDSIHKILIEKDIMKILNHENILKLYKTIQSNSILFFELEFAGLGSLLNVINTKLYLEVEEIQYIVAQIIEGLIYMHQRKIVYGDLKAENVLLNENGIVKICDFNLSGTATLLKNQFQGTKVYMAPELIDNNEKTYASDFWSLGVLVHLLYYRRYPFDRKTQSALFFNILNGNVVEEDKRKAPKNLRKFIMDLLVVNSAKRLGKNFQDFVDHPFFYKFDWKNYKKSNIGINLVQDLKELDERRKRRRSSNKDKMNTLMDTSQNNFLYDIQDFTYEDNEDSDLLVLSTSSGGLK